MPDSASQPNQPSQTPAEPAGANAAPAPVQPAAAAQPGTAPATPPSEGAGKYLAAAFKTMAWDPVGQMMNAYKILGEKRAGGMGVALGAGFIVCLLIGGAIFRLISPSTGWSWGNLSDLTAKETLAIILGGAVIYGGMAVGALVFRTLFKDGGTFSQDLFVAGVSVYPMAPMVVLSGLTATILKSMVAYAALMFGGVLLVVVYYSAGTDFYGMNKRVSSMMAAIVVMATTGIAALVYNAIFR